MTRPLQLMLLARQLNAAADDGNWEALAKLDGELAASLPALAGEGPWTAAERHMVGELASAHAKARRRCAEEARRLDQILAEMRASREGWLAYGTSDDIGDSAE